jgi:hypothetical protein
VAEWLKAHAWKACIWQHIEGSNPFLSARFLDTQEYINTTPNCTLKNVGLGVFFWVIWKKAQEIEELSRKHREIKDELKEKVNKAFEKESQGHPHSQSEQNEIEVLANKQEKVFNELAEKVKLNK